MTNAKQDVECQARDRPVEIELTPELIETGVNALREWLDTEDRFCGWDALAVRDVFLHILERVPNSLLQTVLDHRVKT
jgi:hypothetical protein